MKERFWSRFATLGFLFSLVFVFFLLMARLDYYVNDIFYQYGLRFSYNWAVGYWAVYTSGFVIFALMGSFVYWFASRKSKCDLKVSFALAASIILLALGGFQDVLFFAIWDGHGLPGSRVDWWWAWQHGIVGSWNSSMQLGLFGSVAVVCVVVWWLALRNPEKMCTYPF